ncbi:cytokine-inducible SH2-containing protein-like [Solea senegalensis]|uniref:Cytokine-inducible SH2-containing protein n=1 Tax=Solea senegalensis TaxID=28829 RepID=A0AAV6QNL8_SOLSE|nr:cytokine-inducible SH2-containing protein-like [Solea senegalensis]KAG7494600.1 cytokine-inducible SH2-containing protein-like [Solea senegalensis]
MVARAEAVSHHEEREGSCCPYPSPSCWNPAEDLRCVTTTLHHLQTSGWYWGSISASEAREALLAKSEGTFLVRDSSHPRYILALSVKTRSGPTSVRIEYRRGRFWLDSVSPGLPHLQSFPNVLSLIQHYKSSQEQAANDIRSELKPDPVGGVPLQLTQPLHKPEAFPSLQHLVRLTINSHTNCPKHLPLPKPLLHYLQDYPFHI